MPKSLRPTLKYSEIVLRHTVPQRFDPDEAVFTSVSHNSQAAGDGHGGCLMIVDDASAIPV